MPTGYIYLVKNLVSRKIYVGQTTLPLEMRWRGHVTDARNYATHAYLHKAIRKYGDEKFEISALTFEEAATKSELKARLDDLERHWIKTLNSCDSQVGYQHDTWRRGRNPDR